MDARTAAQLRANFDRVQEHLDGHAATQAILCADNLALSRLCVTLAEHIGLEHIDGLPVVEWYERERRLRLDTLLLDLETDSPGLAALLQDKIDASRAKLGQSSDPHTPA